MLIPVCILSTALAADGGSRASAQSTSDHYLCCAEPTNPLASAGTCAWDTCPNPGGTPGYVYLYSQSAVGQGKITLNGGSPTTPLAGVCFSPFTNSPDLCWTIYTSPDFVPETNKAPAVYVPTSFFPGYLYEACYIMTTQDCGARLTEGSVCCDMAQPIPAPMPPGSTFSTLSIAQPVQTITEPAGFFAAPVPALPLGLRVGFGAALIGIGLAVAKRGAFSAT
jgi:hypothetical protein